MGIIYIITNDISPKVYIGQTRQTLEKRWKDHIQCGKSMVKYKDIEGRIKNIQNSYLYRAMAYHGIHHFQIAIVEECSEEDLDINEQHYIDICESLAPNGYNLTSGGTKFTHNEDTIALMKKRKHELIDNIRNEKLQGLPPKVTYRNHITKGEQIVVNNHALCKHKTFSSITYQTYEAAKQAAIIFFQELARTGIPYIKPKKGEADIHDKKGFCSTPKGYRVNKVHKGENYDKRFERLDRTREENKIAALAYYEQLLKLLNINQ